MGARKTTWASDRELVDQILAGSREHFELLYDAYFGRVYGFALKRLGDPGEAEDVTQEVFMTLLDALASFQGQSSLLVWIFGVTRNKVNRRFRGARPRIESFDEAKTPEMYGTEARTEVAFEARCLLGRCQEIFETELSPLQQRIFSLKHRDRLPIKAIAGAIGKSEDAVKAQLYRIRRLMSEGAPGLEAALHA